MSAPALYTHNTVTATGGEDTLFTLGDPGIYEVRVDVANMADGDTVILRRYVEDVETSAFLVAEEITLTDSQDTVQMRVFGPFGVATSSVHAGVTVEQTEGTLRDFPYSSIRY